MCALCQLVRSFGDVRRVFVSIYESNSRDSTPQALQALQQSLQALGVPHSILTHQDDKRAPGEHRIAFLARMRNKALQPLHDPLHMGNAGGPFQRVVFINDVYFCAWQVSLTPTCIHTSSGFVLPSLSDARWGVCELCGRCCVCCRMVGTCRVGWTSRRRQSETSCGGGWADSGRGLASMTSG